MSTFEGSRSISQEGSGDRVTRQQRRWLTKIDLQCHRVSRYLRLNLGPGGGRCYQTTIIPIS